MTTAYMGRCNKAINALRWRNWGCESRRGCEYCDEGGNKMHIKYIDKVIMVLKKKRKLRMSQLCAHNSKAEGTYKRHLAREQRKLKTNSGVNGEGNRNRNIELGSTLYIGPDASQLWRPTIRRAMRALVCVCMYIPENINAFILHTARGNGSMKSDTFEKANDPRRSVLVALVQDFRIYSMDNVIAFWLKPWCTRNVVQCQVWILEPSNS